MSEFSPDDSDELTEPERAQAVALLRAAKGRYQYVSDQRDRTRLSPNDADSPDEEPTRPRRRPNGLAVPLASGVLRTAREALEVGPGELAAAAGCAEALVRRIESGDCDPALDTLERILNASGLEIRAGHNPPTATTPRRHQTRPKPPGYESR